MNAPDKIKQRLAYLLNLASKTSNTSEAENAYAAAQKLMTKHQLSEADAVGKVEEEIGVSYTMYVSPNTSIWKERLANCLARNNGCYIYLHPQFNEFGIKETRFALVGTESNRELVEYFFKSILEQTERLCKINLPRGGGKTWANNFKIGVVDTVAIRVANAKKEAVQESVEESVEQNNASETSKELAMSNAMVLLSSLTAKSESWARAKINIKNTKIAHKTAKNYSALDAGRKAGNSILLNKALK